MATPWTNIEAAFWDFLEAQTTYDALGLTAYKGYDGVFYPFDVEQDAPSTEKLPCIIGRLAGIQITPHGESGLNDNLLVQMWMFHDASGAKARATAEAALEVIQALMDNPSNQPNLGSSLIEQYEMRDLEFMHMIPEGHDIPVQWRSTWEMVFKGNRRFLN